MTKNLCTICMRGGSKGVKSKNIRELNGKPLMAYTIEQALNSNLFEHVVVSTDSSKIAKTAKNFGAEVWFLRPKNLSTDEAPKVPVIRHALLESEKYFNQKFDFIVDLDATSPLRTIDDIINAFLQFNKDESDNLITGNPSQKNPYFNMVERINGKVQLVKKQNNYPTRRQDAPKVYDMNASIYIWKRQALLENDNLFKDKTSLYIMPKERSIDIDNEFDWNLVNYLMRGSIDD